MDYYVGEIKLTACQLVPIGWLQCDGALLNIVDYEMLYSLLGTVYGGDGITTFALPDMRGRAPIGTGTLGANIYQLGILGGEEFVELTANQIPPHTHQLQGVDQPATASPPTPLAGGNSFAISSGGPHYTDVKTTTAELPDLAMSGSGDGHLNIQPSLALHYIIAYTEVEPPYIVKRTFKPVLAGPEADWIISRGVMGTNVSPYNQLNGEGLFNSPYAVPSAAAVNVFRITTAHIVLKINDDFKVWRYPTDNTVANSTRLRLEKIDGVSIDCTQYSYMVTATADWVPFTEILPAGTYKFSYGDGIRSDLQWYIEKHPVGSGKLLNKGDRTQHIEPMQAAETTTQKVSASSEYGSGYVPYKTTWYEPLTSFDGWFSSIGAISPATPQWWAIEFKLEPKTINGYEFVNRPNTESVPPDSPKSWILQGRDLSTDSWTDIHTVLADTRNLEREVRTFYLDTEVTFYQFRMLINETNRPTLNYVGLFGLRLFYRL